MSKRPEVILYTNSPDLFSYYHPVRSIGEIQPLHRIRVSLISTVKNEVETVSEWAKSILAGSRLPDEIIVVDAGSSDGTMDELEKHAQLSTVPFKVLKRAGVNIAQGRNIAISNAQFPVIASTDFGCVPRNDWLEKLVAPFEDDREIQVVAGWYEAIDENGNPLIRKRWPTLDQISPRDFIPSSRSVAFKKSAWQASGGYPEWLSLTGEDTYFAINLKTKTDLWAFVPDAVVEWFAPDKLISYWKKQYYWSIGDGEAALHVEYYKALAKKVGIASSIMLIITIPLIISGMTKKWFLAVPVFLITLVALIIAALIASRTGYSAKDLSLETGAKIAQLLGYIQGVRNRKQVKRRR